MHFDFIKYVKNLTCCYAVKNVIFQLTVNSTEKQSIIRNFMNNYFI